VSKRGAARGVSLELSPAYECEAERLLREAGVAGGAQRRLRDIAVDPDAVEPADVVVLHRVVCCYPEYARLLPRPPRTLAACSSSATRDASPFRGF
jgi:hypothetical protein